MISLRKEEKSAFALLLETENNDMVDEVVRRVPPFSLAAPFFAQRSHYWRSYLYRQQLAYARSICDEEAQERLLTHLLINLSLLTKDLSRESKADRAAWIVYLKNYSEDKSLAIKNRLLANALWLALEVKHTEAQWNKFVYLLQRYCLRGRRPTKSNFYYSLLLIVACASDDRLVIDKKKLNFDEVLSPYNNRIETLFEAQIILAPYAAELQVAEGEIIAKIEEAFVKRQDAENYICLLRAAVQLIPVASPFWQSSSIKYFKCLSRHLSLLDDTYISRGSFSYERMNLVITLMLRTGFDAEAEPWKTRLNRKTQPFSSQNLFNNLLRDASSMICLYNSHDETRLAWLEEVSQPSSPNHLLFDFAPRVCARLKTDVARKRAVDVLMFYPWLMQSDGITRNLIKTLILTQQMSDEKRKAAANWFEELCSSIIHDKNAHFLVFDFLDDVKYYSPLLEKFIEGNAQFFIVNSCQHLKSSKCQVEWLKRFRQKIDDGGFTLNDSRFYAIATGYTLLLCKQASVQVEEIKKWNYQLTSSIMNDPSSSYSLKLIKILLPHLELGNKIDWMDLLLNICSDRKQIANVNRQSLLSSDLLECLAIGMSSLPIEIREKYSHRISQSLTAEIFNYQEEIELHINLFQQLSDTDIPLLEQRASFSSSLIPGGVSL